MSKTFVLSMLAKARLLLGNAGVNQPQAEAENLLTRLTGYKRHELYLRDDLVLPEGIESIFLEIVRKRCEGMPIQYLTGSESFMGMDFKVNSHTLIPRADTETLVEKVINFAKMRPEGLDILDLCTGSGNIAISLAKFLPVAKITATDISQEALNVACENARLNAAEDNIVFLCGDMFEPLDDNAVFDCIVSNPPYIKTEEIPKLEPQVRLYEPVLALDGGIDGLNYYRTIISQSVLFLKKEGLLALEVGHDQAYFVKEMLTENGNFENIEVVKDLTGTDRVVTARLKSLRG